MRRATFDWSNGGYQLDISIHALREEGDRNADFRLCWLCQFLSTPSVRRATFEDVDRKLKNDISIHALREEGDEEVTLQNDWIVISIHALREEGDPSTPYNGGLQNISIHALREEGDWAGEVANYATTLFLSTPSVRRATGRVTVGVQRFSNFYPRPP